MPRRLMPLSINTIIVIHFGRRQRREHFHAEMLKWRMAVLAPAAESS